MITGEEHMPISKLTPEIIAAAITGFELQKGQLALKIAELRAMLPGATNGSAAPQATAPKRRKLSAAARKRIAAAQKERWAKYRGESKPPAPAPKPRRKLSAAAKAKLVANLKKARAAKAAKAKRTVGKKTTPARKMVAAKKAAPVQATTQAAE